MRRTLALSVVALAALGALGRPTPAAAQSLLSTRGLGLVVQPADGRGAALGGVALGLTGDVISWANPAESVGIPVPGFELAFQYDEFTSAFSGIETDGSTARFPLMMGAFPIGERAAVTLGMGGFLDQNWAVQRGDTLLIGADSVPVLDRFTSEGGVARVRLGGGYRLLEGLAVGAGVDFYTGGVERTAGRLFPGESQPGCCRAEWSYGGVGFLAGVDYAPNEAVRLSAAASVGGTLDAETDDSLSVGRGFDMPATVMAGGSARIASDLLVAASADWAGWSSLEEPLASVGGARDSWSVRGGAEWDGLSLGARPIPIRLGGRYATLPFRWDGGAGGDDWLTERALTGGLGLVLGGGGARGDVGVEAGSRGGADAGLDESFWRVTFSLSVLGR